MNTVLIVIAIIIVVALSAYATQLLLKLKRQTDKNNQILAERQAAAEARKQQILTDIRYIAQAMLEDRCELSEGVMRIGKLFDALSMSERVNSEFPNLFTHYSIIHDHPIKEERKALPKQERMKLDFARMKSEAELNDVILAEAKVLSDYQGPKAH